MTGDYMLTAMNAIALAMLCLICFRISGSSLHPSTLYSGLWSMWHFLLFLSGGHFAPLTARSQTLYLAGALAFCLGSLLAPRHGPRRRAALPPTATIRFSPNPTSSRRLLWILFLVAIALLPFFYQRLVEISALSGLKSYWMGVRHMLSREDQSDQLGLFRYWIPVMTYSSIAVVAFRREMRLHGLFVVAYFLLTLTYQVLTASRLPGFITILGCLFAYLLDRQRPSARAILAGAVGLFAMFGSIAILLNKGAQLGVGFFGLILAIFRSLQLYILGGLVAMDQVLNGISPPPTTNYTFRFFLRALDMVGISVEIPRIILPYTFTPTPTNVYTIYYGPYVDFGPLGVIVSMSAIGYIGGLLFNVPREYPSTGKPLYAIFCAGLCVSSAIDFFILSLSYWLQAILFFLLLLRACALLSAPRPEVRLVGLAKSISVAKVRSP